MLSQNVIEGLHKFAKASKKELIEIDNSGKIPLNLAINYAISFIPTLEKMAEKLEMKGLYEESLVHITKANQIRNQITDLKKILNQHAQICH